MNWFERMLSDDHQPSSKRVMGVLGWIVALMCVIHSMLTGIPAPIIVDSLFIASSALLGLESVTTIFKKKGNP